MIISSSIFYMYLCLTYFPTNNWTLKIFLTYTYFSKQYLQYNSAIASLIIFLPEKSSSFTKFSFTKSLEIFCRGRTVRITLIITDGIPFTSEQCLIILQSSNGMWTLLAENDVKFF